MKDVVLEGQCLHYQATGIRRGGWYHHKYVGEVNVSHFMMLLKGVDKRLAKQAKVNITYLVTVPQPLG